LEQAESLVSDRDMGAEQRPPSLQQYCLQQGGINSQSARLAIHTVATESSPVLYLAPFNDADVLEHLETLRYKLAKVGQRLAAGTGTSSAFTEGEFPGNIRPMI